MELQEGGSTSGPLTEGNVTKESRRVPREQAASPAEIRQAINSLTDPQWLRLEKYAAWRIRGLARKASGRAGMDLLQEAVTATLEGRRSWNKASVDFVGHLLGVMRSMSTHWGEQFDPDEARTEAEVAPSTATGDTLTQVTGAGSQQSPADDVVAAREAIETIEHYFAKDQRVLELLEGLREGLTGPEVQELFNMSPAEYEAAKKRLRRGAEMAIASRGGNDA